MHWDSFWEAEAGDSLGARVLTEFNAGVSISGPAGLMRPKLLNEAVQYDV